MLCERVFWAWEVFQHTRDRGELKGVIRQLQRQYKPIIRSYAAKRTRNKRCRGMAKNLLKAWPALWTFAAHHGVQPTNNHAKRALRSAVIHRKLCLATNPSTASTVSHGSYPRTPPAVYKAARCSPTSPTRSARTLAAIQRRCSPERTPTEQYTFNEALRHTGIPPATPDRTPLRDNLRAKQRRTPTAYAR
jgi:Transposase IS66 family